MINILNDDVKSKISAGEVVEDTSSVVKELLENSIDSNPTRIDIELINSGLDEIKIEDNGCGILFEDKDKLFVKHATSKISHFEDIYNLCTYGFRGEALYSISGVSDVTINSKAHNSKGFLLNSSGSKITDNISIGTSVTVNNLFSNVPVRRKFMKSTDGMNSILSRIIKAEAIINPQISFNYILNGRQILKLPIQSQSERIISITQLKNFREIYKDKNMTISGSFTIPSIDRNGLRSKASYIFVNRRLVENRIIKKAIDEAYKFMSPVNYKNTNISYVLFLNVNPAYVDVNSHPRKLEVRFSDSKSIFNNIYASVRNYISQNSKDSFKEIVRTNDSKYGSNNIDNIVNELKSEVNKSKEFEPNILDNIEEIYKSKNADINRSKISDTTYFSIGDTENLDVFHFNDGISDYRIINEEENDNVNKSSQEEIFDTPEFIEYNPVQFNKKFIVYFFTSEFVFIDQHAASERINYERITKLNKEIKRIQLLIPYRLPDEIDDDTINTFEYIGFVIKNRNIIEVPFFIKIDKVSEIILSVLEENTVKVKEKFFATLACKSAIKFGDTLSKDEMNQILHDLSKCDFPNICAHGRPLVYRLSEKTILKNFSRC